MTNLLFEAVRGFPDLSGIPSLFSSAFASPEREEMSAGPSNVALLGKPFEVKELLEAIEATCDPTPVELPGNITAQEIITP